MAFFSKTHARIYHCLLGTLGSPATVHFPDKKKSDQVLGQKSLIQFGKIRAQDDGLIILLFFTSPQTGWEMISHLSRDLGYRKSLFVAAEHFHEWFEVWVITAGRCSPDLLYTLDTYRLGVW